MVLLRFFLFLVLGMCLCRADDERTVSPKGSFEIVQHFGQEGWSETLHFKGEADRDVSLEHVISWPGDFYVSPDERWILRIQKSGSGENISWLYFLEKNGSVWRMEKQLGQQGFDYLARQTGGLPPGLYHTGIEFESWDLKNHLLHFEIHGAADPGVKGIETTLTYQLLENRIVAP